MCPRRWCYHWSSMDSASTTAWVRLEVTWENLLCVLPPPSTEFCIIRAESWLYANHPTNSLWFNVIDQTIGNRVVQSSYLRWHNFLQPANFLACTLIDIFHQKYLWWYNYWYYYITLMDIVVIATIPSNDRNKESIIFVPSTVWCPRLCWIHSHLLEKSTHPLCVFTTERECICNLVVVLF